MKSKGETMKANETRECCKLRPIKRNRFGLTENPIGLIVSCAGRLYEVTGLYCDHVRTVVMLRVKHFNGEAASDIVAGAVLVVPCHFHDEDAA